MKRKMLALSLIVICLATSIGGSLAYYVSRDTAHNVITSGNVKIEVVEQQKQEDGTLVEYPKEPISGVVPGTSVSKLVKVENTGSGEAWIRVRVDLDVALNENAPEKLPAGEKPDLSLIQVNYNGGKWIQNPAEGSNVWYYKEKVAPGKSTDVLLDSVSFSMKMGNAYQGCTVNVKVNAEAVQAKNNDPGDVLKVAGWPTAAAGKQ